MRSLRGADQAAEVLSAGEGKGRLEDPVQRARGWFRSLGRRESYEGLAVGIAYAIWAGTGIVLIALLGLLVHGQRLDLPAVVGMGLIVAGVAVINLWSGSQLH